MRLLLEILIGAGALIAAQAQTALWLDVPFVHQSREGCGSASISMVIDYWNAQPGTRHGPAANASEIQHLLHSPKEHGIAAPSMLDYFREHGFQAYSFSGKWSDLEEHLRKGRPLIVGLRPPGQSQFHYVVVDGIDPARSLIILNDPAERKLLSEERATFEKDWSATHNWMLLALPLPAQQ